MITTQDITKAKELIESIDNHIGKTFGITWKIVDFTWEIIDPIIADSHLLGFIERRTKSEIPKTEFLYIDFYHTENNQYKSSEVLEITDDLLVQINKDSK